MLGKAVHCKPTNYSSHENGVSILHTYIEGHGKQLDFLNTKLTDQLTN